MVISRAPFLYQVGRESCVNLFSKLFVRFSRIFDKWYVSLKFTFFESRSKIAFWLTVTVATTVIAFTLE